jgi:hypothetical protein
VFSFVRAFDRLNTTTLLTMPMPVSPMAFRLKNALEEIVPVSVMLTFNPGSGKRFFNVTKYLGEKKLAPEIEFAIAPKAGIVKMGHAPLPSMAAAETSRASASGPRPAPEPEARTQPSFGSFIPRAAPSGSAPDAPGAADRPAAGKIRFSTVIQQPKANK